MVVVVANGLIPSNPDLRPYASFISSTAKSAMGSPCHQLLLAPFVVLKGFPQAYKKLTVPWPLLQHERSNFQF